MKKEIEEKVDEVPSNDEPTETKVDEPATKRDPKPKVSVDLHKFIKLETLRYTEFPVKGSYIKNGVKYIRLDSILGIDAPMVRPVFDDEKSAKKLAYLAPELRLNELRKNEQKVVDIYLSFQRPSGISGFRSEYTITWDSFVKLSNALDLNNAF